MKARFTLSFLVLLPVAQQTGHPKSIIHDRDVDGIYITVEDFKRGELSFQVNKTDKKENFKLKQFCMSPELIFINNTEKTRVLKDSVFAVHIATCESYRFIDYNPCYIADTGNLFIYVRQTVTEEQKLSGPHIRQKTVYCTCYYFSCGNHKKVYRLTLNNLKRFDYIYRVIETLFPSDESLYAINPLSGHFKINELLAAAMNRQ
jgi:hypothetical protein